MFFGAGLALAIAAQSAVASDQVVAGAAIYVGAVVCALLGLVWLPQPVEARASPSTSISLLPAPARIMQVCAALAFGLAAFVFSAGNRYTPAGVIAWLGSIVCWALAFAHRPRPDAGVTPPSSVLRRPSLAILMLALLAVILALGAYFRYADLANNPRDMNSDQAEKLEDVKDVIDGAPYIFFERNTGREPWQFYWTVALIKLFNLPQDFMALKLGTSLIGWLMLPAVFLLARELFGTRTALIATLFAAVASWGVITARFGLRYPLAPCAVAWTMYFLVRGLRRQDRNAMLAAGVWIGIGLQGYTAYRFMVVVAPVLVLAWAAWQFLQRRRGEAGRAIVDGAIAAGMAVLVLIPLIRYGLDHPDELLYRAATRLTSEERQIEGNPVDIFVDNVKNVLLMFNYTRDEVWVANLTDRPAMDDVLGGLLVVGAAAALALSLKRRTPWPALLLISAVLMLIPSALSIAFPHENPSVVRTGGALPMLMIVCALAPGLLLEAVPAVGRWRLPSAVVAYASVVALCVAVIAINRQRVFVDYPRQYCPLAQNASDIAHEMDVWVAQDHSRANAYIVGFPHWVDSRAVGIWIGDIYFPNTVGKGIGAMDAAEVDLGGQPGWFALNVDDAESLRNLQARYPEGESRVVLGSQCIEKQFVVFTTE